MPRYVPRTRSLAPQCLEGRWYYSGQTMCIRIQPPSTSLVSSTISALFSFCRASALPLAILSTTPTMSVQATPSLDPKVTSVWNWAIGRYRKETGIDLATDREFEHVSSGDKLLSLLTDHQRAADSYKKWNARIQYSGLSVRSWVISIDFCDLGQSLSMFTRIALIYIDTYSSQRRYRILSPIRQ